jgi:BirA family biotin operon repressor/biotin-[acetyl-CoA-carboxylase] ligase
VDAPLRAPDPTRVHDLMSAAGCPWPAPRYVKSTASTNADAVSLAEQGAPDGTCVVAGEQTAGRGRHGRAWVSEPGVGLWSSTVVRAIEQPAHLPLIAALAVVDLAGDMGGVTWAIKWPNDVLDDRGSKVAGILVEAVGRGAVVGVGINVDRPPADVSGAGCWVDSCGASPDRDRLLGGLLTALHARLREPWTKTLSDYRAACRTLGRGVQVRLPGGEMFEGVAQDVDADGHLLVEVGQTVRTVVAGEVLHATIAP